jgi:hypothetical protein
MLFYVTLIVMLITPKVVALKMLHSISTRLKWKHSSGNNIREKCKTLEDILRIYILIK